MAHNPYIMFVLRPPTRHVGSVSRYYCLAKATEDIPRNANCPQAVIKRKHNFRLTTMFLTITVAFIICWRMNHITPLIYLFSLTDECTFHNVHNVVNAFPVMFHAINPVIYFIFCPSYRQGIKQPLSCCFRRVHEQHLPGSNQIELDKGPLRIYAAGWHRKEMGWVIHFLTHQKVG